MGRWCGQPLKGLGLRRWLGDASPVGAGLFRLGRLAGFPCSCATQGEGKAQPLRGWGRRDRRAGPAGRIPLFVRIARPEPTVSP